MRLLLVVVVSMFAFACGTPAPKCTTSNCMGCCDQMTDTCKAGTEATACGKAGTLCIACPTNQVCSSSAQCTTRTSSTCGAANCNGCCDDTGTCFMGQSASACGSAGATCAVCSGTQTCTAISSGSAFGGRCM
ncbi:MAG: hypothetical protein QM817_22145 [Archangium sp.]